MSGVELIKCQDLYNLLNQFFRYPYVTDPNFLLLLDARTWDHYEYQHIVTAKYAPRSPDNQFFIPYGAELQYKKNVVVYDGGTNSIPEVNQVTDDAMDRSDNVEEINRAVEYANELQLLSKNAVKILEGGFQRFSGAYHFLRTEKMIYMPRELETLKTYPIEIIHGLLYLGNEKHGNDHDIQKHLKIKAHVICQEEYSKIAPPICDYVLHLKIEDSTTAEISRPCVKAMDFMQNYLDNDLPVLVWGENETSRAATIITAYLMKSRKWTMQRALQLVRACHYHTRPNRGFLQELIQFETQLFAGEGEEDMEAS